MIKGLYYRHFCRHDHSLKTRVVIYQNPCWEIVAANVFNFHQTDFEGANLGNHSNESIVMTCAVGKWCDEFKDLSDLHVGFMARSA